MSCRRMHMPDEIHLVTNRCFQGRLFMLPSAKINFIIGYWFARALEKYGQGLKIFAFQFLSNHYHLLVKDTQGTLARFMCYFQANVAKAVNKESGREGKFWCGHYDDKIIVDDADFWSTYKYVTCNAVKAGLVNRSDEWIGWSSYHNALHGGSYRFTAVNRDRYNKACRNRKKKPDSKQFEETFEFSLTPPLGLEDNTIAEQAATLRPLLEAQDVSFRDERKNKPPLGIEAIRKQNPTDRPQSSARSPKRRFTCENKEHLLERLEGLRTFVDKYQSVYDQFKKSATARGTRKFHNEWPSGSYAPGRWRPVDWQSEENVKTG